MVAIFDFLKKERLIVGAVGLFVVLALIWVSLFGFNGTQKKVLRGKTNVGAFEPTIEELMALDVNQNSIPDFWDHVAANILGLDPGAITQDIIIAHLGELGDHRVTLEERDSILQLLAVQFAQPVFAPSGEAAPEPEAQAAQEVPFLLPILEQPVPVQSESEAKEAPPAPPPIEVPPSE